MFTQRAMPDDPSWRQVMELQSRKEVIERWLSSTTVPCQLVEALQEMLATTKRELQALEDQAGSNKSSSVYRQAG